MTVTLSAREGKFEVTSPGTRRSRLELTIHVEALTDRQKIDIDRAALALNIVVRYDV